MTALRFTFPKLLFSAFCLTIGSVLGFSQNTSTVFSPDVDDGEREFEYRIGYEPDGERFAHRAHFQYGLSESWRMRLIFLQRASEDRDLEFRYMRWEGQWQFIEDEDHGWDSALRFEVQIAEGDDLPSRGRIAWSSKWDVSDQWQLRTNLLFGHEVGEDRREGTLLEFRGEAAYKVSSDLTIALDLFSDLNRTNGIGTFEEQEHQLGPLIKYKLGDGWSMYMGYLWGMSDAAPDDAFRFNLIKGF